MSGLPPPPPPPPPPPRGPPRSGGNAVFTYPLPPPPPPMSLNSVNSVEDGSGNNYNDSTTTNNNNNSNNNNNNSIRSVQRTFPVSVSRVFSTSMMRTPSFSSNNTAGAAVVSSTGGSLDDSPHHSVRSAMPTLASAPTSGNFSSGFEDIAAMAATSTEMLQGAVVDFLATASAAVATSTTGAAQPVTPGSVGRSSYIAASTEAFMQTPTESNIANDKNSSATLSRMPNIPTITSATSTKSTKSTKSTTPEPASSPQPPPYSPTVAASVPPPTTNTIRKPTKPLPYTQFRRNSNVSHSKISTRNNTSNINSHNIHNLQNSHTASFDFLSATQTSIPILILATERAHEMAWKNHLFLSDMFEGLAQKVFSSSGQNQISTTSINNSSNPPPLFRSATRTLTFTSWDDLPTLTFTEPDKILYGSNSWERSASDRPLDWDEIAAHDLQKAVVLQESDGNLQHELAVLEDQIDNLLYDSASNNDIFKNMSDANSDEYDDDNLNSTTDDYSNSHGNHPNSTHDTGDDANGIFHGSTTQLSGEDVMGRYERIQRRQEQAYKDAYQLTSALNIPWLWRYRQALDESTSHTGFIQHEMFRCPVLILNICTTAEDMNPIDTLKMLQNQPFYLPPSYYRNGLYDPTSVRHEVLVMHDNHSGPQNWDESALRNSLQRTYGSAAAILRINSIPPEKAMQLASEETSDLWGGKGAFGNCLSVGDRATIRKYLSQQLTKGAILPALERRVADLNAIVNDRKRGVKNVLKSLWGGGRQPTTKNTTTTSNKDSNDDDYTADTLMSNNSNKQISGDGTVTYRYDSIESQTRLLGDTLFLMKDYDAALSMYRLIKDDYKQDRTWLHYGNIQEIIALCLYCIDPYRNAKEIFSNIEGALLSYSRAAAEDARQIQQKQQQQHQQQQAELETSASVNEKSSSAGGERAIYASMATRLATRLCLVLASTRNICNGRHMEVADLLASASSGETSLGAAVLLEQSSAHYYKAEMYRKFAFHMLMSGHMFRSAVATDHHAFRCFTSALHIYNCGGSDGGRWEELQNHIRSALAALLFSMGRMAVSLQLYAKLLGCTDGGRVSIKAQQKFISNLIEICNDHHKKALAGVERMSASPTITSAKQRERVRKANLDRIVQVVQYTKSASRVLELPNMNLPHIHDSTVVVIAEEEDALHHYHQNLAVPKQHFGEVKAGSTEIWDDLMLWTTAELKACNGGTSVTSDDELPPTVKGALQKIEDEGIRRVVTLMEKEKANRALLERTKRRGGGNIKLNQSPPVRAEMEPIAVEFTMSNPLGIPIDVTDMQLVAKMSKSTTTAETSAQASPQPRLCTNEDAVSIKPLASYNEKKKWTFQNSSIKYEVADFCRVSSTTIRNTNTDSLRETWRSAEDGDPFFVVTKTNYTIQPQSKMNVSASICPLTQGNLEIVGVRCRLLDDVWVYHPFEIKGPLLQNTRSNRANRIRGESFLLKSKVERGMPCINVELLPRDNHELSSPGTVSLHNNPILQAQIGKWTLRVANVGTAPASNITMKTNVPWVNIDDSTDSSGYFERKTTERTATSYCIGPTGTLMHLPIDKYAQLKTPGLIQQDEFVDIPIEIRTSDGVSGKQALYMLFRYELPLNDAEQTSRTGFISSSRQPNRHRWFKKMFEISIYPSLSLSASIAPATSSTYGEHILSVELTNARLDRPDKPEILLDTISVASRHYKLQPLQGQLSNNNSIDLAASMSLKLGWQERASVHYLLRPRDRKTDSHLLSECTFTSNKEGQDISTDKDISTSSSLLNFICLERAHDSFQDAISVYHLAASRAAAGLDEGGVSKHPRSIAEIRRANTMPLESQSNYDRNQDTDKIHPTSVAQLCPIHDPSLYSPIIHIICTWRDVDQIIKGEHHIRGIPLINKFSKKDSLAYSCPITVTAAHPSIVTNDFEKNGPAIVPINVTLRNRLAAGHAANTVMIEFAIEEPDNFDFVTCPLEGYRRTLAGGESFSVPLKAMLPFSGLYNLQKLRITTVMESSGDQHQQQQHQSSPISYTFQQPWMVTVQNV